MDRHAAIAITAAIPVLCALFYVLTRTLAPLTGYWLSLALYWFAVLSPLILWRGGFRKARFALRKPAGWVVAGNIVFVGAVAVAAILALIAHPQPASVLALVVLAAFINGTLEEVFWRGTLLRDDATRREQITQMVLFAGWHIAILFTLMKTQDTAGVVFTGGPLALLAGAAFGGVLWTFARMQTGSIGFGILFHIGLNIFAFTEFTVQNSLT